MSMPNFFVITYQSGQVTEYKKRWRWSASAKIQTRPPNPASFSVSQNISSSFAVTAFRVGETVEQGIRHYPQIMRQFPQQFNKKTIHMDNRTLLIACEAIARTSFYRSTLIKFIWSGRVCHYWLMPSIFNQIISLIPAYPSMISLAHCKSLSPGRISILLPIPTHCLTLVYILKTECLQKLTNLFFTLTLC